MRDIQERVEKVADKAFAEKSPFMSVRAAVREVAEILREVGRSPNSHYPDVLLELSDELEKMGHIQDQVEEYVQE